MARTRPPRGLSKDERRLWNEVAKTATPLHTSTTLPEPVEEIRAPALIPEAPEANTVEFPPDFAIGAKPRSPKPTPSNGMKPSIQMDRKSFQKMSKGKLSPEARIDLHGYTVAEAEPKLAEFIARSFAKGRRLVLVITGKGKSGNDWDPVPQRTGILRHQVPIWLAGSHLSSMVLQVSPAHLKHGGSGAFYVYLRRNG